MHGWIHAEWWVNAIEGWGANFDPHHAASTAAQALASPIVIILYAVGVLSCVFHLANGLWTMGITWGIWVSPTAQRRANWMAIAFGVGLSFVSMGALFGFGTMSEDGIKKAEQIEDIMFQHRVATGEIEADSHKTTHSDGADDHSIDDAVNVEGAPAVGNDDSSRRVSDLLSNVDTPLDGFSRPPTVK
jgi:succinate dehydrogenase / fumarate reductase cytochrome b subunit